MYKRELATVVAAVITATISISSCSGSDSGSGPKGKTLAFWTEEPKTLLPQQDPASQIGMAMCANLMENNPETGATEPLVAKSITTKDAQTYTVKLRRGWTFHDGSKVTASSYVDAWNKTAYGPTGWQGNASFVDFKGYEELNPASGEPTAKKLVGLKVLDRYTIQITMDKPNVDVPQILATNPTCPLPKKAFSDPDAYEEHPFGNGPYEFVGWDHNQSITMKQWDEFPGDMKAFGGGAESLVGKIYTSQDAAYNDMRADALDLIRNVPPEMLEQAKTDLGEDALFPIDEQRQELSLQFPEYVSDLRSPELRRAISLSIDRKSIATSLLKSGATPADSLMTPLFDAYREGACADCEYDPQRAKQLLDASGFEGTLTIAYAAGIYEPAIKAVMNQIQQNLDIDIELKSMQAPEYAAAEAEGTFEGAVVKLWGVGYVSPIQHLSQFQTHGSGNVTSRYSNPAVDRLLSQAIGLPSDARRAATYQKAEDVILADMPAVPLFYPVQYGLHSKCAKPRSTDGDFQYYRAEYTC